MSEQLIKVAAKLYRCRDAVKGLYKGAEYFERLNPYMEILKGVIKKNQIDGPLDAILIISKTDAYQSSGIAQMMFMAAAVEMVEPTPKTPL